MTTFSAPRWRAILRTFLGFAIAPAIPALVFWVMQTVGDLRQPPDPSTYLPAHEFPIVQISAMLGYTLALVNLPLHALFRWRRWNGLQTYLASGALQGFTIYPVYILHLDYSSRLKSSYWSWKTALYSIPLLMFCGVVIALVFWLIVRPDRGVKSAWIS